MQVVLDAVEFKFRTTVAKVTKTHAHVATERAHMTAAYAIFRLRFPNIIYNIL